MHSNVGGKDEDDRIPRLAPDWDPSTHSLTPAEGFLLSRIDGNTTWRALREIGGLQPDEVDVTLERWAKEGFVVLEAAARPGREAPVALRPGIDASLDLPLELQHRILDFEDLLEASYHEILGVEHDADARDIKRAYFRLSKEFHPDRYFRRETGDFGPRLDRIFKRVSEAYELLSDPATRSEIERMLPASPPREGAYGGAGGSTERIGPARRRVQRQPVRVPARIQHLARLRSRFKVPEKVVVERQFKARQFFRSAQVAAHERRWREAAAGMRLAIAFDPMNREYKVGFAGIQADVHRVRADDLLEQADASAQDEALKLLEEALHFRPCEATLLERVVRLCLDLNELEKALEHAKAFCEAHPQQATSQALLAAVYRKQGLRQKSNQALERAAKLDPENPDVKAERVRHRRPGSR